MSLSKLKIALACLLLTSGCGPKVQENFKGYDMFTVEVTNSTTPKHFYVDLKVENAYVGKEMIGTTFEHIYVSKHCDSYRNAIGKKFNARVSMIEHKDGIYYRFNSSELYSSICRY